MDDRLFFIIFIAAALAAPVVSLLVFRRKGSKQVLTGHATVLSRRVEYARIGRSVHGNNWNHRVVFQVGNQELDLFVSQEQYRLLTEGLTGQLSWEYENLVDFVPDSP